MEREFRRPKSRLADWGVIYSNVIKSSKKEEREAEAWERLGCGGPRSKTKTFRARPLLGRRREKCLPKRSVLEVQWKEKLGDLG